MQGSRNRNVSPLKRRTKEVNKMGGGIRVNLETRAKVRRMALNAGMLASKLRVPTLYNIGADVIGVTGKSLIKGYDAGGVRRMIDLTLRWQAVGCQKSVVHGQRQRVGWQWGSFVTTAFESQPNTYNQVKKQDHARYNTALPLRDELFYGILNRFTGRPIENGPLVYQSNFAKFIQYCREKGWLKGISEDEQIPYLIKNYKAIFPDVTFFTKADNLGLIVKLLKGKTANLDGAGKPIENGTPFIDKK